MFPPIVAASFSSRAMRWLSPIRPNRSKASPSKNQPGYESDTVHSHRKERGAGLSVLRQLFISQAIAPATDYRSFNPGKVFTMPIVSMFTRNLRIIGSTVCRELICPLSQSFRSLILPPILSRGFK